ncbi:MAG: Na+:solute symporter [Planctomycetes bacterium]|nr:Na+:solute symporter [Planctomycetota bacterium]MBT4029308.1 Na+:solute symporter [Planctomycetota bacterium]MBT4561293.1 Na+:solute symporter [Planctomycetota bacterium]MBT5100339.1 Na+:solute symporter [Planctomycetota bacterium]MBT7317899.1 Na+:solute symporter [Planctomycetota bacterium]
MTLFTTLDWLAIGLYLAFALGIGTYLAKRAGQSTEEFYLAGRTLPWWMAGTSLVATSFAADTPLVVTGWVRSAGISQNWLWWGMAVGGVLSFVVLAGWWRRLEVTTDAEFIERRYSGKPARFLRGFYGAYHALITNTIVLTWVLLAMVKVVRVVLQLPDTSWDIWIVGTGLVLALTYSFMSGLWGVVVTDFFQFFLALFGALALAWAASDALGGLAAAQENFRSLSQATTSFYPMSESAKVAHLGGATPAVMTPVWSHLAWWSQGFGAFLIFIGVQGWLNKNADGGGAGVQRYSSCKNESHARGAALWFHIAHYAIRPWPWIFVALASLTLIPESSLPLLDNGLPDHEAAYPMMMAQYLGPGIFGLMCASFLAAFMSTLDTHFNLASAYLVNDCYRRFVKPNAKPRHYVQVGRFAEILIGGAAAMMALQADSISGLFTLSLSLLAGLGPALLLRWFWWRANTYTEIAGLATSTSATAIMAAMGNPVPYPLSYALIVGIALTVMLVVTLLTPPTDRALLQRFYDRVRPAGFWGPFRSKEAPSTTIPLLVGWAAGLALIYGLMLGIGDLTLGNESTFHFCLAVLGAILLKWAWPRALPPL